jgi:hypothetical protein
MPTSTKSGQRERRVGLSRGASLAATRSTGSSCATLSSGPGLGAVPSLAASRSTANCLAPSWQRR